MSITKEEAYSILRNGLYNYVSKVLSEKYGSSWKDNSECTQGRSREDLWEHPLQTILQLWTPVFKQQAPFTLDTISTLAILQRKQLSQVELTRVISLMKTTLYSIGEDQKAAQLQHRASNSSEGSGMKGVEGAALVGGAVATGILLYKGASYLLNQLSSGEAEQANGRENEGGDDLAEEGHDPQADQQEG